MAIKNGHPRQILLPTDQVERMSVLSFSHPSGKEEHLLVREQTFNTRTLSIQWKPVYWFLFYLGLYHSSSSPLFSFNSASLLFLHFQY